MKKAGILGGGQLGRMLLQAAVNYPVETWLLENDPHCPAAHLCHHFVQGNIKDFDTVYRFGQLVDLLTIEIEHVNVDALDKLAEEGKEIFPHPSVLRLINNKISQKEYYRQIQTPTSPFLILNSRAELAQHISFLPAVQKMASGGYDGRGVQVILSEKELDKAFDAPSVLEKMVDIHKEIALMVAINAKGETAIYPPVEMVFDPSLNQLDYQLCPADLTDKTLWKVEAIALAVVRNFKSPGLFAVELFVDKNGDVLVNETAPRVHNSGHHSIEANYSSQFDMLWRLVLGYPLGNTDIILPSAMVNLVGAEGHAGPAVYEGMADVLAMDHAFLHLYGKVETRPGRKMGHITILSKEKQDLRYEAHRLRQMMKVKSGNKE